MTGRPPTERNDRGATAVEYSILIAFIAAVIVGVVVVLGHHTASDFAGVVTQF